MSAGIGNPLMAVADSIPPRIAEIRQEVDKLVGRLHEMQAELATLETLLRVVSPPATTQPPRRRHRDVAVVGEPAP